MLEAHLLLIEHGRRVCRAQRPLCGECVLLDLCPTVRAYARGQDPPADPYRAGGAVVIRAESDPGLTPPPAAATAAPASTR